MLPSLEWEPVRSSRVEKKTDGVDEQALINVVSSRSPNQLQQISAAYQRGYGKTMWKAIDDDVSGCFQDLLYAVVSPLHEFESRMLNRAMVPSLLFPG